jgi:hypothetical protein
MMGLAVVAVLAAVSAAQAGPLLDRWHYGPLYGSGFSPLIGTRLSRVLHRGKFPPHRIPEVMFHDPPPLPPQRPADPVVTPSDPGDPEERKLEKKARDEKPSKLPAPGPLPGVDPPPPPG